MAANTAKRRRGVTVYCAVIWNVMTGEERHIWAPSESIARIEAEAFMRDGDPDKNRRLLSIRRHCFPVAKGALADWLNVHFDGSER